MSAGAASTIVVIGAGHATGEFVTSLRQEGFGGRIVVFGEESHMPYKRPPLSKAYLSGVVGVDSLYLRPRATYALAKVDLELSTRVDAIDRTNRRVVLQDGRTQQFDHLAINTGGRVRRLQVPGAEQAQQCGNFHYIRTIDDIDRLRPQLQPGSRLVIIGGGYIGLEAAAVAIKAGLRVKVLEAAPRVLARVTAPEMSAFYERVHREAGVDIRTDVELVGFEFAPSGASVAAVICADESREAADVFIAGVGLIPNVELASAAGLHVENGIVVDEFMRSSDLDIVSSGDCANHPSALYGRRIRLESVPNAVDQARTAAATLCGKLRPYTSVPWFWSDQYDLKLQMAGLSQGHDNVVLRGSPISKSFTAFYLKVGVIIAADAVNRPQDFMFGKRFVAERRVVDPLILADETVQLKSLYAA